MVKPAAISSASAPARYAGFDKMLLNGKCGVMAGAAELPTTSIPTPAMSWFAYHWRTSGSRRRFSRRRRAA